jgi:hypothetical protein
VRKSLQTFAAILVAVVVYIVVGLIASAAVYFLCVLITVIRPGIILIASNIIGGFAGIYAAKAACDSVFSDYAGKIVCIIFCIISIIGLTNDAFLLYLLWFGTDFKAYSLFDVFFNSDTQVDWRDVSIDGVRYLTAIVASISAFWVKA